MLLNLVSPTIPYAIAEAAEYLVSIFFGSIDLEFRLITIAPSHMSERIFRDI